MASNEIPSTRRTACPACLSEHSAFAGEKTGFEMLRCRTCGTLYSAVVPLSLGSFYGDYFTAERLVASDFLAKRLDQIVEAFAPYRATNRLLDVGSGAGFLMQAARRAGWQPEAVEIDANVARHLADAGFRVTVGELQTAELPAGVFDVVTASEVIEHLPDPELVLRHIVRLLRPGGLFWATTPHGRGISARAMGVKWSAVCPPWHLQLYSIRGLRALAARSGFRSTKIFTRGVDPYELLNYVRRRGNIVAEFGVAPESATPALNEALEQSPARRLLKNSANTALSLTRLGDSVKLFATS